MIKYKGHKLDKTFAARLSQVESVARIRGGLRIVLEFRSDAQSILNRSNTVDEIARYLVGKYERADAKRGERHKRRRNTSSARKSKHYVNSNRQMIRR